MVGGHSLRRLSIESRGLGESLTKVREHVTDSQTRIHTGYRALDSLMRGGIATGQVCQIIGRTEVGKTTFGLNLCINAITAGIPTGVVALEMTEVETTLRCLSILDGVDCGELEEKMKTESGYGELVLKHRELPLYITDPSRPRWDHLTHWLDHRDIRPKLVMLDHLKLLDRYGYPRGEGERVAMLAEDAKRWAKESEVALVVIHQARRGLDGGNYNHGEVPLTLEDMMFGGEQDADYVIGLHRPERGRDLDDAEKVRWRSKMVVQLLKNRHGETNLDGVVYKWKKPSLRITE